MNPLVRQSLDSTITELTTEFRGIYSRETIARYVMDSYTQLGDRPTVGPNFLPVIVARFAHERLRANAQNEGRIAKVAPEVLFVCAHNAGRSQMAAALADHLSHGWVSVRSAGAEPDEDLEAVVVEAMLELNIDLIPEFPKPLTDEVVRATDVVVTLGCGDACPIYPGKRYEDWIVSDPAGQPLEVVREIRYQLFHRVWKLLETLVPSANLIAIH